MRARFPRAADHVPHALHDSQRPWPETNCYLDLWIEMLHAMGRDPIPLLGVAAALDWEVDHFTFLKPAASDVFALTGVVLHELALWDDTEAQVVAQVEQGAVPLLEVDAFFLPDTRGNAYRDKHTKTTIALASIDPAARSIEYFHNAGLFCLHHDDYDGVLGGGGHRSILFPYAELARVAGEPPAQSLARQMARGMMTRLGQTRSPGNPIARFADALPGLLARVGPDPDRINRLCFNTTRQLGGAFGLLSDHLEWLGEDRAAAGLIAEQAKALQFQIARSARRARPDPAITAGLDEMAATWDRCMETIGARAIGAIADRAAA